jgi:hypothetical protein
MDLKMHGATIKTHGATIKMQGATIKMHGATIKILKKLFLLKLNTLVPTYCTFNNRNKMYCNYSI